MVLRVRKPRNLTELNRAGLLYTRAQEAWLKGRARSAFRLFLAAARAGEDGAFGILAQFYDRGYGVRHDEKAALRWYQLAYQRKRTDSGAANNMGCIWRDRGKLVRALRWFQRAVELGDADANLKIAKVYLRKGDLIKARPYLHKTRRSPWATEQAKEEARRLLKKMT
jgi:TPR repeat protein